MPKKIIILASGGGSNAASIIKHFAENPSVQVHSILSNRKDAGVFAKGESLNIPVYHFDASSPDELLSYTDKHQPDLIVLAGYLKKIPASLVTQYPNKIVNIHPFNWTLNFSSVEEYEEKKSFTKTIDAHSICLHRNNVSYGVSNFVDDIFSQKKFFKRVISPESLRDV